MKIKILSLAALILTFLACGALKAEAREYGYVQAPSYGYVQAPSYGYVQAPSYGYTRTGRCRTGTVNGWIDWSDARGGGRTSGNSNMFWRMNSMYRSLPNSYYRY